MRLTKVTGNEEMSQVLNSRSLITDTVLFTNMLTGNRSNTHMAMVTFPVYSNHFQKK